ncbi:MAG: hypothetical protein JXQ83_02990, partial [Candidatus Glassbacteria bacterium]|nr:hypothetical protein [Candidatus Glassbacteria bacterium]
YALYCSEAWDMGNSLELSLSLVLGNFFPLDSLAGSFPAGESAGRLAYLQSYTVVDYLFTSRDSGELILLFDRWREAGDLDTALRSSYGTTLLKFEQRWRRWAQVRYGWIKLLTSVTLVWIMAAVLFVFVYLSRRALFRRRLEEMKRRESLEAGGQTGPWEQAAPGPGDPQAGWDGQGDEEPWEWDEDPPE